MTSVQMYQLFQVYMDKIDSQDLPEIQPEQVFTFLNTAVDEYVRAIRKDYEETGQLGDDGISLVKRFFILPEIIEDRIKYDYNKATLTRPTVDSTYVHLYYFINGRIESHYKIGDRVIKGITELNNSQQDDITTVLSDPFNKPTYADKVPWVREDEALLVTPPPFLTLDTFVGTGFIKPATISQTINCDLREQVHITIVKRAAQIALENVESRRVSTYK